MNGIELGQATDGLPERPVPAEAARWIILEQELEDVGLAQLDCWLAESEEHADAYANALAVWDDLGSILPDWKKDTLTAPQPEPEVVRSFLKRKSRMISAGVTSVLLCLAAWFWVASPRDYSTRVGEQRIVSLADGSRVTLNTGSDLVVENFGKERRVRLERGEVLFDVAHDDRHPFLVEAMGRTVRVLGTSFIVRREAGRLDITLLRGSVAIEGAGAPVVRLSPGERFRQLADRRPMIDHPPLDVVTAWREGDLLLDNTPLREAVHELNRYSSYPIVLGDPALGDLRLNGVFKTGDGLGFARTIAAIYGLNVIEEQRGARIEHRPSPRR